jgi:pSer/pThr/pTyr-binding forkhead associated (FHA) protein
MGSIRDRSSGKAQVLELPEHGIGRAPTSALCLSHSYVSTQHAVIRWNGRQWELRDLGSRNGTFLDGHRLKPGEECALRVGSRMAFGRIVTEPWELVDDSAPRVMAVPVAGGDPVFLDGDLLALPSNEDPRVTIYRDVKGAWVLEQPDESILPVTNLQTFEVDGHRWRFCCAADTRTTALAAALTEIEVRHLELSFAVSRDEEHVQLQMSCGASFFDMGARSHNYLLLTLARRRVEDAQEGTAEAACGWIDQEDLAHDPTMTPPQLNIDVFRIRKQFAGIGVVDAANIVERRPRTRQLRIGTGLLSITQL